jgi:hypothetical protein
VGEPPGHGRYYTCSRKVNGHIIREYIGTGLVAELAARRDAEERAERIVERERLQHEVERWAAAAARLAHLSQSLDGMTAAVLTAAGFHQHHRGPEGSVVMPPKAKQTCPFLPPASADTFAEDGKFGVELADWLTAISQRALAGDERASQVLIEACKTAPQL